MSIKSIQEQLGVTVDGAWGNQSQTALEQALKDGKPIKLSQNFYLSELLESNTATRMGISNMPDGVILTHLCESVEKLWQPFRDLLGQPVHISSGYRSPRLNKAVGGAERNGKPTSAHVYGYAIDFTCPAFGNPRQIVEFLRKNKDKLPFDQCIYEFGRWVHLAYKAPDGRQRKSIFDIT